MQRILPLACLYVLFLAMVTGCSPQRASVSGTVKLNGQPLDKGLIVYNSLDPESTASATADIVNGQYTLSTTPGHKQVQITAPIVTGTRPEYVGPGAPLVEVTEERLPAKYHSESELKFDVKAGANTKDWDLQAEPLKR